MADWELQCIQDWRESDPDAKQPTFEDAEKIASDVLADLSLKPIPRRGRTLGHSWSDIKESWGNERADEALRNWIRASKHDIDYWEALSAVSEQLLRDREQLPVVLADWLADMLEGSREKPKCPPGQPWYANDNRDSAICYAISVLISLGLNPTRNELWPPESACDVVGKFLDMKYATIASIWNAAAPSEDFPAPWKTWDKKLHAGRKKP